MRPNNNIQCTWEVHIVIYNCESSSLHVDILIQNNIIKCNFTNYYNNHFIPALSFTVIRLQLSILITENFEDGFQSQMCIWHDFLLFVIIPKNHKPFFCEWGSRTHVRKHITHWIVVSFFVHFCLQEKMFELLSIML